VFILTEAKIRDYELAWKLDYSCACGRTSTKSMVAFS